MKMIMEVGRVRKRNAVDNHRTGTDDAAVVLHDLVDRGDWMNFSGRSDRCRHPKLPYLRCNVIVRYD